MADGAFGSFAQGLANGVSQGVQAYSMMQHQKLAERQMALQTANSVLQIAKLPKSARGPVIDQFNETLKSTGMEGLHPVVIDSLKKAGDEEFENFAKGFTGIISNDKNVDMAAMLKGATSFDGGVQLLTSAFGLAKTARDEQNIKNAVSSLTGQPSAPADTTGAVAPVNGQPAGPVASFTPAQIGTLRALAAAGEGKEALKLAAKFQFDANEKTPINIKFPDGSIEAFVPGTPGLVDAISKRRGIVDRTPSTVVNMDSRMETEYGKEAGRGLAKIHNERITGAEKADAQIATIETMQPLLDAWRAAGGDTGATAPLQAAATSVLQSLGLDPADLGLPVDAGPAQTIQALQKRMAMGSIGQGGMPANNFSEADRKFVEGMQGGLDDTPTGFEGKLFIARKLAERSRVAADFVLDQQADGKNGQQIEAAWRKFVRANPVFNTDDKSYLAKLTASKGTSAADIMKMTAEELSGLDASRLSPAQLQAAKRRYDALNAGR